MILDERISHEIMTCYEKLISEEELPTKAQLERYYETFRNRFGPDVLKNLDDEDLLATIHTHGTYDSLVYWLEFKDDEEFKTKVFGGISGTPPMHLESTETNQASG
jgi:5-methylcytosine-specific restriction protein B